MQAMRRRISPCLWERRGFRIRAPVEYVVSDATSSNFNHEFDVVIDKGTFDAVLWGGMERANQCFMNSEYPCAERKVS